jgi:DNA polymerase-1
VKDFLRKGVNDFEPVFFPTLEADDVLGILATSTHVDYGERIIVTSDKDLLQIPGKHYNPRNGKSATVTESAGDYFFLTQVLTGDPTDGFPGIKGVGPKKAEKILLEAFSKGGVSLAWSAIVSAYERAGQTESDALTMARVARILRFSDINPETNEVQLWLPPSSSASDVSVPSSQS